MIIINIDSGKNSNFILQSPNDHFMKSISLLLLIFSFALLSCNSAFKSMQTPDDVYYSVPLQEGIVKVEPEKRSHEENYIRMQSRHSTWRNMNNDYTDAYYDPYHYGYNYSYYYNPYYYSFPIFCCNTCLSYSIPANSTPRMTNLGSYYNTSTKIVNSKTGQIQTFTFKDAYNNSNQSSKITRGNLFGNSSSYSGSNEGGGRSYSPSNPRSSGYSSGSGSSISRPSRH
jgi:hypothetical protein